MFQTLVIGLGRAGAGLHLPALAKAREGGGASALFDTEAVTAVDPMRDRDRALPPGLHLAESIEHARTRLDPERTVVHLCTPPVGRAELVARLAALGFRRLLIEKPLAAEVGEAERIEALAARYALRICVVAPWLRSALTSRLVGLIESGRLGALRTIRVVQRKPRFERSLATAGHPTAFDVEPPHALGVALRLAGPARLVGACATDMVVGGRTLPLMGSARLDLHHVGGAHTELFCDLTAPVRERRIELVFDRGSAVGHYPVAADDCYARLAVDAGLGPGPGEVFPDETLSLFFLDAYRRFSLPGAADPDFELAAVSVRLLAQAKQRCALVKAA